MDLFDRKRFSKSFLILLALFATVALIGCGGGAEEEGAEAPTPTGTYTINMAGGAGTDGTGGNGGDIYLDGYFDIKTSKSGSVDTSFTVPSYTPINLGTNPLTISTDTTIDVVDTDPDPLAGTPYMVLYNVLYNSNIYISDGNGTIGDETPVTGLQVNAGATLTLGLNYDYNGSDGQDTAYISLSNDVNIIGTLKTRDLTTGIVGSVTPDQRHGADALSSDKGSLDIDAYRIVMGTAGKIDTSGDDATTADTRGGDGGFVYLYADSGVFISGGNIDATGGNGLGTGIGGWGAVYSNNNPSGIYAWSDSVIINKAALNASGGNGAIGGNAGYVELDAYQSIYNTGALSSNGGTGSDGDGGNASYIDFYSYYASIFNSGTLTCKGGNGTANGGNAGEIDLYAADYGYTGNVINSGNITANGGDSTLSGNGGNAERIYFETYGGSIKNSGAITANGGTAMGGSNTGGYGANLYFYSDEGYDYEYGEEVAPKPIQMTGNISLKGGGGPNGGSGGYLDAYGNYSYYDHSARATVELLGYGGGTNLNGGDGITGGGDGGDFDIYTYCTWAPKEPVGSITNDVSIVAKGGAASTSGDGGKGGYFTWETDDDMYTGTTELKNSGTIDVSGGDGVTNGGDSGGLYFFGHDGAENTAAITANGGAASGATGTGGDGAYDYIELLSSYDVKNTGTIYANGGSGTGTNANGGDGGDWIAMYAGGKVTNSGSTYANGGNALGTGTNGDGGEIDLFSEGAATANSAGILSVAKGTGGTGGTNGYIYIDWFDVTPTGGTLP